MCRCCIDVKVANIMSRVDPSPDTEAETLQGAVETFTRPITDGGSPITITRTTPPADDSQHDWERALYTLIDFGVGA